MLKIEMVTISAKRSTSINLAMIVYEGSNDD